MATCDAFEPFQQSAVYAAAVIALGARVRWLELGSGQALAVERGRLRLVSRVTVSGTPDARRQALRPLARWAGATVITPEETVAGFGLVPLITPMHHAIWALDGDLPAGMAAKWRNRLVAAEAAVRVRRGGAETMDPLLQAEAEQRLSRRYRALPEGFTRAIEPGALRLWEWRHGRVMGAAMCFVRHGASASYHLGWASDAARAAGVHGVMLTHAAKALAAEGVMWLDLGTVDTEAAPGLARFKLGTGASLRRLGATCLVLP